MLPQDDQGYPSTLLRGIPNKGTQYFDNEGRVQGYVFRYDDNTPPKNGFDWISVNWEDRTNVETFTLNDLNLDGTLKYKGGAVRASKERLNQMIREVPYSGAIAYNREPLEDEGNPYHGNILLSTDKFRNLGKIARRAAFDRLRLIIIGEPIPPITQNVGN